MKGYLLTVMLLLLPFSPVLAQGEITLEETVGSDKNSGWFVGAGFGSAEVEVVGHDRSKQVANNLSKLGLTVVTAAGGEHDNATSKTLRGGYRFCRYLAVEGAYQDLGKTSGSFSAIVLNPMPTAVSGRLDSEYWTVSLAVIGRYPLFPWLGVYSKIGVHHWDHEMHINGQGSGISIDRVDKHDGNDILYGFGIDLNPFYKVSVLKKTSVRLEWERFHGIENEDGIDTSTLTVHYHF